jgi:hypothetical protein
MLANLRALFGVVVDIVLLRRGPEHLPVSPALLGWLVVLSIIGTGLMSLVTPVSMPMAVGQGIIEAAVALLWFRAAFAAAGKLERFLQTMTAMFAVEVLLRPIMIPLVGALAPFVLKADPNSPPPAALFLITMFICIWAVVVYVRIVSLAFEWPWFVAFLLLVGQFCALVLVLSLLFGGAPSST